VFCGYTLILIIDKVMFDTHALFADDHAEEDGFNDPADQQVADNIRESFSRRRESITDPNASMTRGEVQENMASYLNKSDRFAARMKASMGASSRRKGSENQDDLFVAGATREAKDSVVNRSVIDEEGDEINKSTNLDSETGLLPPKKNEIAQFGDKVADLEEDTPKKKGCCSCNMTPFILMIALSVHAMFEGLALGLETDFNSSL